MPNPVEVLTKAREHLVKYGWRQYRSSYAVEFTADDEPCCALQAVEFVGDALLTDEFTQHTAERLLRAALPAVFTDVSAFNDAPGRTFEDILALYDRAIELAKPQLESTP